MKDTRIKISTLIENQIPKYLRESSPLLIDFLRQYYISVESKGQVLDILENIDQYINIDQLTNLTNTTTLIDDISFFDTDIQVESTFGFPDSYGLIKINDEIISYESKTENTFINCFRGFSGVESYGDSSFEKNIIFNKTSIAEHLQNSSVENLSILFLKEFLGKIKKQILPGFEDRNLTPNLKENIFIKQSKDFYSSKGTRSSFEILFKALYGERVSVIRPSEFLIEPSQSNYLVTKDIVVEAIQGNIEDLVNLTIFQNEDEYFSSASSTVTRVERILRNNKEYYVLSLDFGYDRDLEARGSFIGDFQIHPKTKVIGTVTSGQNFIDVDSTAGFPNSGELVVNRSGIDFVIKYKSKSLNQFFECENVPTIEDGLDIRLNSYAFAISPFTGEEIQFRIGGVLSDLNISDDTILSDVGDTIRIISPGKISNDIRTKNWFYNISVTYNAIPRFSFDPLTGAGVHVGGEIETIDEHNLLVNDDLLIIISNGLTFNTKVSDIQNSNKIVVNPPLPPDPRYIKKSFTYKVKRKILKSKFRNYPELSNLNSNIQNVYEKTDDSSIYVTSPSIPNYFNNELTITDRSILINGFQTNNEITFLNFQPTTPTPIVHSFLTGDVIQYSHGSVGQNLDINEGLYYVKKINSNTIKLAKSREDILLNRFLSFSGKINVVNNKITPFILSNKKLTTQKLVRKIDEPKFSIELNETKYGSTGILLNGVEISNYKSNDFVYYGTIESVQVTSNLSQYDVINPNVVEIADENGVGASIILHINGNLKKVNIENPGFDYLSKPEINISGGNGGGYKLDVNLINFTHSLDFNSENVNSLNLSDNIITFSEEHKFRSVEEITYKTNGKNSIGGLINLSNYYIKTLSSTSIQLYSTEQDALVGINTINLISLGQGIHTIESANKKKKISSVNVVNSGFNYSNKKIIVSPININDKKNTIFAKNHGYNDGDIIHYTNTGQEIGGLPEGDYYVKFVSKDEFSLSKIIADDDIAPNFNFVNNTIVKFENKGSGDHIFNYPEITFSVDGVVGVNTFSSDSAKAKVQPIFRGKIENVFVSSSGKKYGSSEIINFEKQPSFKLIEGSGALLKPIILNGKIEKILILNGGNNYNTPPEIKIAGSGSGVVLTPIIENGRLKDIIIINKGNGYKENSTNIIVETNNLNNKTKFKFKIKSWNIDEYFKLSQANALSQNKSILTEPLNIEYELQYKHIALPNILRESLFISKIIENESYFISDKNNDGLDESLRVHSPIVGWAYDGNPIYGPYGFDTPQGGSIRRMNSGYSLSTDSLQNRPSILKYELGFFVEDYIFTDNGDLDIHNGRYCVTPEFPNGVYAYFCTIDEQFEPKFPYVLGNFYKSIPIEFNFDRKSNQDIFDVNKENLIRNTTPYKLLSNNSNYEYLINPNSIKNQNSKVTSISSGSINSIDVISPGIDYKIGEKVIIESAENDDGFGASAEISELLGKDVEGIDTNIKIINNVQFSNSNVINNTIAITESPHNLINGDFITIKKFDLDDIFLEEIFYKINVVSTTLALNADVSSNEIISYFSVDGNLNYPFIIENDVFIINEEEILVLSVDLDGGRIKVLRGHNSTTVSEHLKNDILVENTRKFYFNKILDKNYKINREYYFDPEETVGVGTTSGVGIGTTLVFSNPGVGVTQVFVPTRSLYLRNHNLKTGDKLIYNTNGGVGIKVSNDGDDEFLLNDNDLLYVAKISDSLIGISTNRVALSPQGDFVGIETTSSILFFKDFGVGLNHSLTTKYDQNLSNTVNNIKSKLTTKSEHGLSLRDTITLNVVSLGSNTYNLFYDFNSRNLAINKTLIESINNSIITITNHNYIKGQKVLFNSSNPPINLSDGEKYYVLPLNTNQIKLSRTYFGSFNNEDMITFDESYSTEDGFFLSLINPQIEIFKNSSIIFDLTDQSLLGFDFNIFEDANYNNVFYGFNNFDVVKTNLPGTENASLILNIKETEITELYYSLTVLNKNEIFFEKLEYFNDSLNIKNNNTLLLKNSVYSGEQVVSGIGTNYFEFNLNSIPESLNYVNTAGDQLLITGSSIGSDGNVKTVTFSGTSVGAAATFTGVAGSTSGNGVGATFDIERDGSGTITSVNVNNPGFGYVVGNTIVILGSDVGGVDDTDDVTITIIGILVNSTINYKTKSKNALGPISKVRMISNGRNYKKLPVVGEIITEFGKGSSLKVRTNTIGKIQKLIIEDIGFDYFSDNTLKPFAKIPEILKVNPLSSLDTIKVLFFGEQYNFPPDLVLLDGITQKIVKDVILDFNFNNNFVSIVKNTNGINDVIPTIIPINNSNGINISEVIVTNNQNELKIVLSGSYSDIVDFPFVIGDLVLIENTQILENTGKSFNSSNYNYKLLKVLEIEPQIGGENPFIILDASELISDDEVFGIYDANSSFGIVTPQKYFPKFEITLKKNIFFVGETVISGNKSGVVEFWDSKNELLKINTIDNFDINSIITGKSSSYNGVISDIFKFKSFYDIDSSSIVVRSWQDSIGFLNDDLQRIHNNEYYQYFSYSLKSIIQYNDWEGAVSSLNHTSGFKKFSDLDVEIKNPTFISDDGTEKLYAGIQTSQNKGNFTSLANIDSFAKFSCRSDYDLVSENSDKIDNKLISDQIYFESRELIDYFNCIGNRVLSIDDISDQFRNTERINTVNRFPL